MAQLQSMLPVPADGLSAATNEDYRNPTGNTPADDRQIYQPSIHIKNMMDGQKAFESNAAAGKRNSIDHSSLFI